VEKVGAVFFFVCVCALLKHISFSFLPRCCDCEFVCTRHDFMEEKKTTYAKQQDGSPCSYLSAVGCDLVRSVYFSSF
jgi:hypothetical protein